MKELLSPDSIVVAIAINLLAAAIIYISKLIHDYVLDTRGVLSGEWVARHLSQGEVEKLDLVVCRHRKESIHGTISRVYPPSENAKKWRFTGAQMEGRTVGYYWPAKTQYQTGGYGVFLMKKGGPVLEGHYFQSRTEFVGTDDGVEAFDREGYKRFRLRWERLTPKQTKLYRRIFWKLGFERQSKRMVLRIANGLTLESAKVAEDGKSE